MLTPHYIQTAAAAALSAGALTKGIRIEPDHVDLSYVLAAKERIIASEALQTAN